MHVNKEIHLDTPRTDAGGTTDLDTLRTNAGGTSRGPRMDPRASVLYPSAAWDSFE